VVSFSFSHCIPTDKIHCYSLCSRLSRQDSLSVWTRHKKIAVPIENQIQVPQSTSPWPSNHTVLAKIKDKIDSKRRKGFKTETKENIKE